VLHENIKKFSLTGEMNDDNVVEERERLILFLENQMRDSGIVPVLDMDPQFTLNYMPDKEAYKFELSIYGTKVGKDTAWQTSGIMNGKPITKTTVLTK
jgi:hypothetical protein